MDSCRDGCGGDLRVDSVTEVAGLGVVMIGMPPDGEGPDWVVIKSR